MKFLMIERFYYSKDFQFKIKFNDNIITFKYMHDSKYDSKTLFYLYL